MKLCNSLEQVEMLSKEIEDARATLQNLHDDYQAHMDKELSQRFVDAEKLLANIEAEAVSLKSAF